MRINRWLITATWRQKGTSISSNKSHVLSAVPLRLTCGCCISVVTLGVAAWHTAPITNGQHMKKLLLASLTAMICASSAYAGDLTLWYDKPAKQGMNEALPIGNGRFGGLVYAVPKQERIVLNEISLWTGTEISTDDYSKMGSYQIVGEIIVHAA